MMPTYGFQVCGQFPDGMPSGEDLAATARAAERAGFEAVWAGEHLSFHHPIHEAIAALSYLAGATQRVGLGAGVILAPLRQPVWLAKAAASLDHISAGRLVLGLGVGGEGENDFAAAGVSPRRRGDRTDEYIDAMHALWASERASYAGDFVHFDGITIEPKPARSGGPPVWIGGKSRAAALRAARRGDGWIPAFISPRQFAEGAELVREEAARLGRPPPTLAVAAHTLIGTSDDAVRDEARRRFSERYQQTTPDHILDKLCLVGGPGRVQDRVEQYVAAGATHVACLPMAPAAQHESQIELLREHLVAVR